MTSRRSRRGTSWAILGVLIGCATSDPGADGADAETNEGGAVGAAEQALWRPRPVEIVTDQPTTPNTPVGLAIEVENGVGAPLRVRAGQRFWLDQIDLRAVNATSVDQGVDSLDDTGDFAHLDWRNTELEEFDFIGLPNPDGTFTRRAYYRSAKWMERPNVFALWQVDHRGRLSGLPIVVNAGQEQRRTPADDFFVRRLRAIQWTNDCVSKEDCSTATNFQEEALVEVRNSLRPSNTFRMQSSTRSFALWWNQNPTAVYSIPVEQVATPEYDYGFRMDVTPVTPPAPDGTYAPGTDVTFQIALRDGSGNRLHPEGSLPTYNEALAGDPAGISYYRAFAFIDASATYYRRKHRERMLMGQIIGPAQDVQPIFSIASLESFLFSETQLVGQPAVDGVYSEVQLFPSAPIIFGGAFTPGNPQWNDPVDDTMTFHIPEDATPGTYLVTLKGRRVYLGQDIPRSVTIEVQVGTPVRTEAALGTGPCTSCHSGGGELGTVLHANDNRAACAGCHVPLAFELEGPIQVRTHFIHSRSDRFGAELSQCSSCHLDEASIQRTSKAACLSCHTEYPAWHEPLFGSDDNMYIGGEEESFNQCTDSCHTTHPNSGL